MQNDLFSGELNLICKLCCNEYESLSRSHIFPKGFFANLPEKANIKTYSQGGQSRVRQSALIDSNILCASCEEITSHLDTYAIEIFRDKRNSFSVGTNVTSNKFVIFNNVNYKKLKAFFASMLWRVSASNEKEVKNLSVGDHYFQMISNDLLNDGSFSYVDVFTAFLTNKNHSAFMTPKRIRIDPVNTRRDSQSINGWQLEMPNLLFRISLDKRNNPLNHYLEAVPSLTGKEENILVTSSLNAPPEYNYFMCMQTDEIQNMVERLKKQMHKYNKASQNRTAG